MSERLQPQGSLVRWLNRTPPAKLFLYCFVFVILAGLCAIASNKLSTGWNWKASYELWQSPEPYITDVSADADRATFISRTLPFLLNICAFIAGTIGGLLPMWAVGRLIADAIREGHTNE